MIGGSAYRPPAPEGIVSWTGARARGTAELAVQEAARHAAARGVTELTVRRLWECLTELVRTRAGDGLAVAAWYRLAGPAELAAFHAAAQRHLERGGARR